MSLDMTHEDVRAALALEALDALDGEERRAVHAHLQSCEECRRELAALREASAALAYAAPARPMEPARSGRVRARLLARAAADRGGSAGPVDSKDSADGIGRMDAARPVVMTGRADAADGIDRAPSVSGDPRVVPIERARERRSGPGAGWLAAAASFLLLLGVGAWALSLQGRLGDQSARVAALGEEKEKLEAEVAERDSLLVGMSVPGARVIDLAGTQQQRDPQGRMFWDPATDRWTFFAKNLPALRPGRDYQLWIITPDGPIPSGTFKPQPDGTIAVHMVYALPPDSLRAVAVTEEPEGGLPRPSTTPIILGEASATE